MKSSFFKNLGPIKYTTINEHLECTPINIDEDTSFNEFTSIKNLKERGLSFLFDNRFSKENILSGGAILCNQSVQKRFKDTNPLIIVNDVHSAVAKLSNIFYRSLTYSEIVNLDEPKIDSNCNISHSAVIENGAIIGKNVNISSGCYVGHDCIIGDDTFIDSNTVITNSVIAESVYVGRNSSLGQQGFGFAINKNKNIKIFHIGKVILQAGVHIGSNCTIDRGSFGDTIIGQNTYFDNLCHVAHNVIVGNNCIFAAMTGIAGSTNIGNDVMCGRSSGYSGTFKYR
ncbi:MAG: UDP-3-O-(3-hydroxymyristoyl)glucosamine N-acyltransferase [Candidatus Pelagibacterales bacterium]